MQWLCIICNVVIGNWHFHPLAKLQYILSAFFNAVTVKCKGNSMHIHLLCKVFLTRDFRKITLNKLQGVKGNVFNNTKTTSVVVVPVVRHEGTNSINAYTQHFVFHRPGILYNRFMSHNNVTICNLMCSLSVINFI